VLRGRDGKPLQGLDASGLRHVLASGVEVERRGLAVLDDQCARRALPDAVAEAVAVGLLDQSCLAVDELQRALGTGDDAIAAPVTQLFLDTDDLALFHGGPPARRDHVKSMVRLGSGHRDRGHAKPMVERRLLEGPESRIY